MKNKVNIILAAGDQKRWNSENKENVATIKQLVKLPGGKILIDKIQEQFHNSVVVTSNKAIELHAKRVLDPFGCDCTVETFFSTRKLWADWTTVLLGDVLYGEETVTKIKHQHKL